MSAVIINSITYMKAVFHSSCQRVNKPWKPDLLCDNVNHIGMKRIRQSSIVRLVFVH